MKSLWKVLRGMLKVWRKTKMKNKCLAETYCKKSCQEKRWQEHKKVCKKLKSGEVVNYKHLPRRVMELLNKIMERKFMRDKIGMQEEMSGMSHFGMANGKMISHFDAVNELIFRND